MSEINIEVNGRDHKAKEMVLPPLANYKREAKINHLPIKTEVSINNRKNRLKFTVVCIGLGIIDLMGTCALIVISFCSPVLITLAAGALLVAGLTALTLFVSRFIKRWVD